MNISQYSWGEKIKDNLYFAKKNLSKTKQQRK